MHWDWANKEMDGGWTGNHFWHHKKWMMDGHETIFHP
jgi:hypothetical protein